MYEPAVFAQPIELHASHPPPSYLNEERRRTEILKTELKDRCSILHSAATNYCFNFPDRRLIQYDCGMIVDNIRFTKFYFN